MEKITIKEILEFRNKSSEKSKRHFAQKLKTRKAKVKLETEESKNGGNYWVISNSVIYNIFKFGKDDFSDLKIEEVNKKIKSTDDDSNILMYSRNIEIICNFKEFDILSIRPDKIESFENVPKSHKVFQIENLPIYLNPQLIFKFKDNETIKVGALLIASRINGYTKSELKIIIETLYRFIHKNFGDKFEIDKKFCIVVDSFNASKISYSDLDPLKKSLLINTLQEIKNL